MTADLSAVLAGKANKILCPLCLREFDESDIEENVTEEHVIPSSAGGAITTLTCKKCNSKCGTEIDSHFARVFRIEKACQTGGEVAAQIKTKGSVGSPAQVSFTPDGLHYRLEPTTKYVREVLLDRLAQYAEGQRDVNFSISNNIDSSKLVASMVKAAYLSLFVDWGYRYIVLPNRDWVRDGIRKAGPERDCFEQLVIPMTITDIGTLPVTPTRMSFDAVCNGVNLACSIIDGVLGPGGFWVLLPPMFDMNAGSCTGLQRAADGIRGKTLTITFNAGGPVIREVS